MLNGSKFRLIISLIAFLSVHKGYGQTNYTWNGSVSSAWSDPTNWTPNGLPGPTDNITLSAAGIAPLLDDSVSYSNVSISGGTPDLGGYTIYATGNLILSGGTVSNGVIHADGSATSTAVFTGISTAADCYLHVVSGLITVSGGTYSGVVSLEQTGAASTTGTGGATFNNALQIINSGSGNFRINGNCTYNGAVQLETRSTGYILPELTTGSTYNSTLTCNINAAGNIRLAYLGNTSFNDNIVLNSSSTGYVYFCEQATATATLATTKTISAGTFNDGRVYLQRFTQNGTTAQSIALTGTAYFITGPGTTFNGDVDISAPQLGLNGTVFNGVANLTKTGATNNNSNGNNIYNAVAIISNSGTGNMVLSNTTRDIFHHSVTFNSTGSGILYAAHNDASGTQFDDNISVNSTGAGIRFCQGTGTVVIAAGKSISTSTGFSAGGLYLRNLTQAAPDAIIFNWMTGTSILYLQSGCVFDGDFTAIVPQVMLNGAVYNGITYIEKTGATNNMGTGGNSFNNLTTFINSGAGYLMTGNGSGDDFNTDLVCTNTGAGIYLAYSGGTTNFNGNVEVSSTGTNGIQFGQAAVASGASVMAAGKVLSIGPAGFSGSGDLRLRSFTYNTLTPMNYTLTGTSRLIIGPASTLSADVNFNAPQIYLQGATFSGTTVIEKSGATNNDNTGGNTFNGITTLTNSGTGNFNMSNVTHDIFNQDVTLQCNGSGVLSLGVNDAAGTQFNGNIVLNCSATGGIRFGQSTGTCILADSKTISIGTDYSAGSLYLRNFTQTGSASQTLNTFTGTTLLYLQTGTTFNGAVNFAAPQVYLNGATYNNTAQIVKTGATTNNGTGANTFNSTVLLRNTGSGIFTTGNGNGDTFNADAVFENTGAGVYLSYATGTSNFNGNITVSNSGTNGIQFGQAAAASGSSILADTKTITIGAGGFSSSGTLRMRNFTQTGTTSQSVTLTGTAAIVVGPGSSFDGALTFTAPSISLNGATFNADNVFTQSGTAAVTSTGGNTYNGVTTFTNTGTGYMSLAGTGNDIFNGDIIVNNAGGGGLRFAQSTGTVTLADTKKITIGPSGFTAGSLMFRNFTQAGATPQAFDLTGTAITYFQTGTTWNANLTVTSPQVYLNGSTFNGVTSITKNGASNNAGTGNNTFNGTTTLNSSGTGYFMTGNGNGDTFNGQLTLNNTGAGLIYLAHAGGTTNFNGNIFVNSTASSTGIQFSASTGYSVLGNGAAITVGGTGFTTGTLLMRNFTQNGNTAQAMTLSGTAILTIGPSTTMHADVDFSSPQINLNGGTYFGITQLSKTGATNNTSTGNNVYNAAVTIRNSGTGTFTLANTTADDYNSDATFIQTGTGALYPAATTASTFAGNISTTGTSTAITFGNNANGRVVIDGNGMQQITGASAQKPLIRRLRMSTTGSFTLGVPVDISSDLNLVNGIIFTDATNVLTMTDESATANIGDAGSYVNGPMNYIMNLNGTSTLIFPVGKGGDWRPMEFTATHNNTTAYTYSTEMFTASANALAYLPLPPTVDTLSDIRYWSVNRTPSVNANLTSATVRLYYDNTGNNDAVTDPAYLTVVKTVGAGTTWNDVGGTASGSGSGNILSGTFTSSGLFTFGNLLGGTNALPVEFLNVTAIPDHGKVKVNWSTASENGNDYFVVERSSDGNTFKDLLKTPGAGATSQVMNYSETDFTPLSGISYYRIRQVDFDGDSTYSKIVSVNLSDNHPISVYPNPSDKYVTVEFEEDVVKDGTVKLVNAIGQTVIEKEFTADGNKSLFQLNVAELMPGVYQMLVLTGDNISTATILKE